MWNITERWDVNFIFLKSFPSRSRFIKASRDMFCADPDASLTEVLDETDDFFKELESNLDVIVQLYTDLNLETP